MEYREALRIAVRAIRGHTLRSTLTVLGIVIGVAAVVLFVTLGVSVQAAVVGEFDATGEATRIFTWAGPEGVDRGPGFGAQPVFTSYDRESLRALEGVADAIPVEPVETTALTYRGDTVAAQGVVTATAPAYFQRSTFDAGRAFESGASEAVLTPPAAAAFAANVTVGEEVELTLGDGRRRNVTVVGVLNASDTGGVFGAGGPRLFVPLDPFHEPTVRSPTQGVRLPVYANLVVEAESPTTVDAARANVRDYLQNRSDAAQLLPRDYAFETSTADELLDQISEILDTLTAFVTSIALVSLLVGAIGIANIMLVSVTERTREIGIMKAVGAHKSDVLSLFLLESVVLGLAGSAVGVVVGVLGAMVAGRYVDVALVYPLEWFAVAVLVGVVVGVLAGLYPAWRGARTDPIEALRYE